ncbi:MAG: hypothetical protein FWH03_03580 [Firmicutes bacterium]|nr:hypothetical protein [Bacillota bacterium]
MFLLCVTVFSACELFGGVKDGRTLEGVTMTTESLTYPRDVEVITVIWENNTDKNLLFGDYYHLERQSNNKWQTVKSKNTDFNDIGYDLAPHSAHSHSYPIKFGYSNLKAGKYRLAAHFFDFSDIPVTEDDKYWVYAEFDLLTDKAARAAGHFFMTGFGGGLQNFPFETYRPDHQPEYYYPLIIPITSKEQTAVFSEVHSQTWNGFWEKNNIFTDLIASYDDAFFKDKQLITFFVTAAGGAYRFELSLTVYADGVLRIYLNHFSIGGGHDALVDWFAIVEVDKIPADTEIEIIINNRW